MPIQTVIFDFDGTIADSFELLVELCNRLSTEMGFKSASPAEIAQFRNMNSRQLLRQAGIPLLKVPEIIRRLKQEINREICNLEPIAGMPEALYALKQQGLTLGILTSNVTENVAAFLAQHQLQFLFDFIYSGATLFGKSRMIRRCLRQQGLLPGETLYVGDETRDIEAAHHCQIAIVAVGWGFNTVEALMAQNPTFLAQKPMELPELLAQLASEGTTDVASPSGPVARS